MNLPIKKTKIFVDTSNLTAIKEAFSLGLCDGITTNPTILRKEGVTDYRAGVTPILKRFSSLPVSLEVFSDDHEEMYRQAKELASWGKNVAVKIPCINTKGESSAALITRLASENVRLNITAIHTRRRMKEAIKAFQKAGWWKNCYISIFAGRLANIGIDPVPIMTEAAKIIARELPGSGGLIWASSREVLNIYQAVWAKVQVITVTPDLIKAYHKVKGKTSEWYELDTVKMFYQDGKEAGYKL